jgi:predicted AlkP superfamily phosphohydrolase/phosphomutase
MTTLGGRPPLAVLAFDMAHPDLLRQGAREGWLPALASVMGRGCWGRLAGPEMVLEVPIWATAWSGLSPEVHGFYNHFQLKPGTYEIHRLTFEEIRATPFWAELRGAGRPVAVLDAPDAPCVPGLLGEQLANFATHYPIGKPQADPPDLLGEASKVFGGPVINIDSPVNSFRQDRQALRTYLARAERRGELCRRVLGRGPFDLFVAVFAESHSASHRFWKYRPEAMPQGSPLAGAIREAYQAVDLQVGRLLAKLPAQANVVVLSPMGLRDLHPITSLMEDFCRRLGYHADRPAGRHTLTPRALIRRALPLRWRRALRRLLPASAQDNLLADKYASSTDWSRTTVFSIPSLYVGLLRVNLRGREPQGSVSPGPEYERLLDRVSEDLRQLIDPEDGQPAVRRILRAADISGGGAPDCLPDLIVDWRTRAKLRTRVFHPRAVLRQGPQEYLRANDHDQEGFLAAAGPGVAGRGDIGQLSLLDLAPTCLSLLGLPAPTRMTGCPAAALLGTAQQ